MRDWSHDVDPTREVRPELGYMTRVISSNQSWAYDQSHDIPGL
jgi:hypothetical protein